MSYANAAAKNAEALRANEAHPDTALLEDHHKDIHRADGLGEDNKIEVVSAEDAAKMRVAIEHPPEDINSAAHFDELRAQKDNAANQANKAAKDVQKTANKAADKAGQAGKDAQNKANQATKDAQKTANQVGKDAQKKADQLSKDAKNLADKATKEGKQFVDDAAKKAKQVGKDVEAEAQRLYDNPEKEGKRLYNEAEKEGKKLYNEASAKGKDLKNELDKDLKKAGKKAEEWEKEGRELVKKYPQAATGIIGAINAAVLVGVGYSMYSNWNKPHWDRRTVTMSTLGLLTFFGGQGFLGYYEYEKDHQKTL